MSTVLINTNGLSQFQDGTELANLGQQDNALKQLGISLTDTDNKPVLRPNRQVIDVVNDFSWYAGPKATNQALNKVPCVFLTEREQLVSSLVSGGLYYLNQSARSVNSALQSKFVTSLIGKAKEGGTVQNIVKTTQNKSQELFNQFNALAGGTADDRLLLSQNNLKSLEGIYFTKPTGFNYRLPIYSSPSTGVGDSFNDSSTGLASTVVNAGMDMIDNIAKAVNFAQPGVFVEKPKYFQGAEQGRTESVTFPLANTIRRGTISPIQQNYELLWLLAFQNKPYRTSFSRTPPPKIYSVNVPGQFSFPYAYMSSMKVDFEGTVRKTSVTVPSGNGEGTIGSKVVQTPVPEVYQVTLEFTSLIGEYGNTMLADAFSTTINNNIVRVGR